VKLRQRFLLILLLCLGGTAGARECPDVQQLTGKRHLVAISDLHFGLGKLGNQWVASEDFRWPQALAGFLERISTCSKDRADLVIAGDALELWQPPKDIACRGANQDTSCSKSEWVELTRRVVAAHKAELAAIGAFAARGANRVYFVPGNHDAALHIDEVWHLVLAASGDSAGRVMRCSILERPPCSSRGVWLSEDGKILVEHGHQGEELNKFRQWPPVSTIIDGVEYLERPWGQYFVQTLFNKEEGIYRVIDNIVPETAGAKLRILDRGIWSSVKDIARLVKFNIVTTSAHQKVALLSGPDKNAKAPEWDIRYARTQGYRLLVDALASDDPLRAVLTGSDAATLALQKELSDTVESPTRMSDTEILTLCDQLAVRTNTRYCFPGKLGGIYQRLVERDAMLGNYLGGVLGQKPFVNVQVYIYGHTHELKSGFGVETPVRDVRAYNTGAFQRLVDGPGLERRAAAKNISPQAALKTFENESLPPCYTAVIAAVGSAPLQVETVRWHMEENGQGDFVSISDPRCQ